MSNARTQIIATTCDLLESQGYHATGLSQIIKESGSPRGSLYYYFPGGKEELATEAVRQAGSEVLARIRTNLAFDPDPARAIQAFIERIALHVEQSGYRAGGPITTVAMESAATNERLRAVCHTIYGEWQEAFTQKLEQGGLPAESAKRLAALISAAIEGGIILCRSGRSREPLEYVAGELAQLIEFTRAKEENNP